MSSGDSRFEIAAHAASLGVWDWDLSTNEFYYSARAKEICGFPADEPVTFADVRAVTHPDDYPRTSAQGARAVDPTIRSKEPYRYRVVRADTGEVRWVLAHGEAVFEMTAAGERAVRYIGTLQDITAQHHGEQALLESEARLRLAVEAGHMAVWEIDLDRNAITPSAELNALFGFPPDAQPTIEEFQARYAPGEEERIARESAEVQARGETEIQTSIHFFRPDGTDRWLLLRARLAPPSEMIARRVVGVVIDITPQKLAERRAELIAGEMQHRVKNLLSIVHGIAVQTFRKREDDASRAFMARLQALAIATQNMRPDGRAAGSLRSVIEQSVSPYRSVDNSITVDGPDRQLSSQIATNLALALHELSTNAVKYGALSAPGGRVTITWTIGDDVLNVHWIERGGPLVTPPDRTGFGTRMLTHDLFGTDSELSFYPQGVESRLRIAL